MALFDVLRDILDPDTNPGIHFECADCGERFDTPRGRCPVCGSTEIGDVGERESRPDA